MNTSISPIDVILTGTTTLGQIGSEVNYNEGVRHIPLTPKLEPHCQM